LLTLKLQTLLKAVNLPIFPTPTYRGLMSPALGFRFNLKTAKSLFLGHYTYCLGTFLGTFFIKTQTLAPLNQDFYLRNGAIRGLHTLFNSTRNPVAALKESVLAALGQPDLPTRGAPCQYQ
jgi:hypothetical protein